MTRVSVTNPPPKSSAPAPVRRERRAWPEFDRVVQGRTESRFGTGIAVVLTLLLHGSFLVVMPRSSSALTAVTPPLPPPPPAYTLQPLTPDDLRFVETNPDSPEAEPDKTINTSDRNTRAAQEKPDPNNPGELPTIQGEQTDMLKVVTGDLRPPVPLSPPPSTPSPASQPSPPAPQSPPAPATPPAPTATPTPPAQPTPATQPTPKEAQPQLQTPAPKSPFEPQPNPANLPSISEPSPPIVLPEAQQGKSTDENGAGIKLAEKPAEAPKEKPTENPVDKPPSAAPPPPADNPPTETPSPETTAPKPAAQDLPPSIQATQSPPPAPDSPPSPNSPPRPLPRPQVQQLVAPGPLVRSSTSARDVGAAGLNSRLSVFGVYTSRMMEAIRSQWFILGDNFNFAPGDIGSHVIVVFQVDWQGNIVPGSLQVPDTTSSRGATSLCVEAVQRPAPFDPWTQEMIDRFGQKETVQITFYYR
jgi:hypothetical protein